MDSGIEKIKLFDLYLEGELSASEKADFEHLLRTDVEFSEEFESHKKLLHSFGFYVSRKRLKNRLEAEHRTLTRSSENVFVRPLKKKYSGKKLLGVAASIAMAISIGTYLLMNFIGSFANKEKAYYKELSRDLERVKSSQNRIIKELNAEKQIQPAMPSQASFGGTAVALSSEGYVLTGYHVVKEAKAVFVQNKKFGNLKAVVVYKDPTLDLAILKIEDENLESFGQLPFNFRKSSVELGEKVYTLGYPKQDIVFGEGYISSLNGYEGDTSAYQITVPVNPGQSGGPLFDENGSLVGIVSGKHTENEGSAFAVKAEYLKVAIQNNDSLSAVVKLPKANLLKGQGKIFIIKKMQDYVFEVKTYN